MTSWTDPRRRPPVDVLVVEAADCHLCRHAHDVLDGLSGRYPLRVRSIDMTSTEGMAVIRRTRAPFPPVVLVDGRLFGHGRLSARKLEQCLKDLQGA